MVTTRGCPSWRMLTCAYACTWQVRYGWAVLQGGAARAARPGLQAVNGRGGCLQPALLPCCSFCELVRRFAEPPCHSPCL